MNLRSKQKVNLAEFFRELSVAVITVGGITAIFDKTLQFYAIVIQFVSSLIFGMILLTLSLYILKR